MNPFERLIVELTLEDRDYNSKIDGAKNKSNDLKNGLAGIGGGILAGATAGAIGLGAALFSTIGPASDLSETANKIGVVFGDADSSINSFAANSAKDFGMSRQAALDAAATFGVFGKSAGKSGGDLADFSKDLVGLSADFASFYNTSPEQAAQAIGAGLRGESEPLRAYGVLLDDATLKAEALKQGLISSTKDALSPQNKVLAAQAVIMRQGAIASGDFQKTSNGLANQQRIIAATLENTKTVIGNALLPAVGKIATAFSTWLANPTTQKGIQNFADGLGKFATIAVSYLPQVISGFQQFVSFLQNNQGIVIGILAALTVAVGVFAWTVVSPLLPVIAVMALVGAAAYLIYEMWTTNFGGIQDKVKTFVTDVTGFFNTHKDQVISTVTNLWNGIVSIVQGVINFFRPLVQAFQAAMSGDWYTFGQKLREYWDNAWNLIKSIASNAWTSLKSTVRNLINDVINFFRTTDWGKVGRDIVSGIGNGIGAMGGWLASVARNVARSAYDAIRGFFGIHSPSTVMAIIGQNLMQGLAIGIDKNSMIPVNATVNASYRVPSAIANQSSTNKNNAGKQQKLIDEAKLASLIVSGILAAK